MKHHFLALGKQTLIYGLSSAGLQIVGVITVPIFARAFTAAEYGVLELASVGVAAMLIVADLGMSTASQRSYYDYPAEDRRSRGLVLSTAIPTSLTLALALALVLIGARSTVAKELFAGQDYAGVVAAAALTIPVTLAGILTREVMRLTLRPWQYVMSSILTAAVGGAAGIALVVWAKVGIEGVFYGLLLGGIVAAVYGGWLVRQDVGRGFSLLELRTMLAFGLPLIPTAVAMWGLSFADRIMLGEFSTLSDVGQFAVASRVALVLTLGILALSTAFTPFILSIWSRDREEERRVRARVLTLVTLVLTMGGLVLALFAREIISVVAPSYDFAYHAVGILVLGVVGYGISNIVITGISLSRRTRYFAIYSVLALGLNLLLNLLLIPAWGVLGAATATASAFVLLTSLQYRKAQQLYPTPYELRKVLAACLCYAAIVPLGAVALEPWWLAILLKLSALAAFVGLLFAAGAVERAEIQEVVATVRSALPVGGPDAGRTLAGVELSEVIHPGDPTVLADAQPEDTQPEGRAFLTEAPQKEAPS